MGRFLSFLSLKVNSAWSTIFRHQDDNYLQASAIHGSNLIQVTQTQ